MDIHTPETLPAQLTDRKGTGLARELFTPDFWITGLAILKYIPRSFRAKQIDGMVFLAESKHNEFRDRVLAMTPTSPRHRRLKWGKLLQIHIDYHLKQFAA
jgi:hypothetical protein